MRGISEDMFDIISPFLTCQKSVTFSNWNLFLNKELISYEILAEEWGPDSTLSLEGGVLVDWNLLEDELKLDKPDLTLCIETGTGKSQIPWVLDTLHLQLEYGRKQTEIFLDFDNRNLFGKLTLNTRVILSAERDGQVVSPGRLGDIVWRNTSVFSLEAGYTGFPVTVIDFNSLSAGNNLRLYDNPWFFEWSPGDWDYDISAAVHLFVNSRNEEFYQRFIDRDPISLRLINSDLIYQVCSTFVLNDVDELYESFMPGSMGWQAYEWIKSMWNDRSINELKSVLLESPSVFSAECMKLASV